MYIIFSGVFFGVAASCNLDQSSVPVINMWYISDGRKFMTVHCRRAVIIAINNCFMTFISSSGFNLTSNDIGKIYGQIKVSDC